MKPNRIFIAVLIGVLFQQCARTPSTTIQRNATQPAGVLTKSVETASKKKYPQQVVFFTGSFEDLLKEAKRTHRAIFLDFMATWCGPCRQMEQETFADAGVAAYANERYLAYKVDVDWFAGMDIADRYGVKQYPTIVFLDAQGKYIGRTKGFQPPALFTQYLKQYGPKLPSDALSSL